jgi:hypothetical protein
MIIAETARRRCHLVKGDAAVKKNTIEFIDVEPFEN